MIKSILLISMLSLFISNAVYIPTANAGFLKDAIKEKLRREVRKKLRQSEERERRKRQEVRRERRRDNHHRKRYANGNKLINATIRKINRAKRHCLDSYSSWRQEGLCFRDEVQYIRASISENLRHRRLRPRVRQRLSSMRNRLFNINNACKSKDTWKNETRCFARRLDRLANQ